MRQEKLEALLDRDFATKEDLEEAFEVTPRTIERWTRLRVLPQPQKIGRQRVWSTDSLRDHLLGTGRAA